MRGNLVSLEVIASDKAHKPWYQGYEKLVYGRDVLFKGAKNAITFSPIKGQLLLDLGLLFAIIKLSFLTYTAKPSLNTAYTK